MLYGLLSHEVEPVQVLTYPEVRITNLRGESFVLSVSDTWEEAMADADWLVRQLYDDGVHAFCERFGLPDDFAM